MKKIEVSLRELIIFILRKWYLILIAAIIFTGFSVISSNQRMQKTQQQLDENLRQKTEKYQQDMEVYLATTETNSRRAELLTAQKAETEAYLNDSVMMTINPYDFAIGVLSYEVNTDEGNTILARVTNHYVQLGNDANLLDILEGLIPQQQNEAYLRDAIRIIKVDNDIISIIVTGNDEMDPLAVADAIGQYITSKHDQVTQSAGTHTLSVFSREIKRDTDRALVDARARQQTLLASINNQLNALIVPEPQPPVAVENENRVNETSLNDNRAIVQGIIGGIAIGVVLALIWYFFTLPVQYKEQLERQLNVRYLGSYQPGRDTDHGSKANRLIIENLKEVSPECKKILLMGRKTNDKTLQAIDALQKDLLADFPETSSTYDILNNPDAVQKLSQADCVVFVEKLFTSRVRDVNQDLHRITQANKPVVGYVIL